VPRNDIIVIFSRRVIEVSGPLLTGWNWANDQSTHGQVRQSPLSGLNREGIKPPLQWTLGCKHAGTELKCHRDVWGRVVW
jgi:hypothetical protein